MRVQRLTRMLYRRVISWSVFLRIEEQSHSSECCLEHNIWRSVISSRDPRSCLRSNPAIKYVPIADPFSERAWILTFEFSMVLIPIAWVEILSNDSANADWNVENIWVYLRAKRKGDAPVFVFQQRKNKYYQGKQKENEIHPRISQEKHWYWD